MLLETTLKNGVEVYSLGVENDFQEAQRILDISHVTNIIDAYHDYNDRVSNDFVGVYKIKIERKAEHERIERMIFRQKRNHRSELMNSIESSVLNAYKRGLMDVKEARKMIDEARIKAYSCNCKLCSFHISYEEWKNGKMSNGTKVGKAMRKAGIEQDTIDLYSLQSKTEKEQLFVISDLVQHIAGMSYYSDLEWDGMNGSSCQNPENDYFECNKLGASLHDNKLFIGFTIDNLEDLKDMERKMTSRVVMRYLKLEGTPVLVATNYYGNNESKSILHSCLEQLEEHGIFSNEVTNGSYCHKERTNGTYYLTQYDTVYINETIEEYVTCECPMCNGSGEYEVYSDRLDKHIEIDCPMCNGSGEYETSVYEEIEHEEEVEEEMELTPYDEGYDHYGSYIKIWLDIPYISEKLGLDLIY